MGYPTYRGLELVRATFANGKFPLDEFRIRICDGPQLVGSIGIPVVPVFLAGIRENLRALAEKVPYGRTRNSALCSSVGGYGIRFVEEYFLHEIAASDDQGFMQSLVTLQMEPYGCDEFVAFVRAHESEIRHMARYGKEWPSLTDRFTLRLMPLRYRFPTTPSTRFVAV